MENIDLYQKVRSVPDSAKKTIKGGRTSGMTDINPMWRIKAVRAMWDRMVLHTYTKVVRNIGQ